MDRCLREAIKVAGRDRYEELTRGDRLTSWTNFLTKSRDNGLLGSDTNKDGNSVIGLANQIKSAAKNNPKFDPDSENAGVCRAFVRQFTNDELLDELILTWAYTHGYLNDLPPTRPHVKRDDAEATKTSDYDIYSTVLPGNGAIPAFPPKRKLTEAERDFIRNGGYLIGDYDFSDLEPADDLPWPNPIQVPGTHEDGKWPLVARSAEVSNSAARSLHHGHLGLNEQGLPANITIPGLNFSLPVKWMINGTLASGDSSKHRLPTRTVDSIPPPEDLANAIWPPSDKILHGNSAPLSRSTVPTNSTELEKLVNAALIRGSTGPFDETSLDDIADALVPPPNTTDPPRFRCGNEDLPPPNPDPISSRNRTRTEDPSTLPTGRIAQEFQA